MSDIYIPVQHELVRVVHGEMPLDRQMMDDLQGTVQIIRWRGQVESDMRDEISVGEVHIPSFHAPRQVEGLPQGGLAAAFRSQEDHGERGTHAEGTQGNVPLVIFGTRFQGPVQVDPELVRGEGQSSHAEGDGLVTVIVAEHDAEAEEQEVDGRTTPHLQRNKRVLGVVLSNIKSCK